MTKIGRPFAYGSTASTSSQRISAFRSRAKQEGLTRIEALVSEELKSKISKIAKAEGLTQSEAAFGLLEFGAREYETQVLRENAVSELGRESMDMGQMAVNAKIAKSTSNRSMLRAYSTEVDETNQMNSESIESPILSFLKSRNGANK